MGLRGDDADDMSRKAAPLPSEVEAKVARDETRVLGQMQVSSLPTTDASMDALLPSCVIDDDGIFVTIASYCDRTTLLRLCTTLSKAGFEGRCKLAVKEVIPADPRRTGPVQDEGWDVVLRERIALDKRLVFTYANPIPGGKGDTITASTRAEADNSDFAFGVCGRVFAMRQGIHKAIFTYQPGMRGSYLVDSMNVRVGIVSGATRRTCLDYAVSVKVRSDLLPRMTIDIGLEYNCENGRLSLYKKVGLGAHWAYLGEVTNPSAELESGGSYCWAAEMRAGEDTLPDIGTKERIISMRRPTGGNFHDFSFATATPRHQHLSGLPLYREVALRHMANENTDEHQDNPSEELRRINVLDEYLALSDSERSMYDQGRHYIPNINAGI